MMGITEKIEVVEIEKARQMGQKILDGMSFNRDVAARILMSMARELEVRRQATAETEETIKSMMRGVFGEKKR